MAAARFRDDVDRLTGGFAGTGDRLGLAVSGGPDSLALLLLAAAAFPGRIAAATVDHGLRPEAAAEAEFVATLCQRLGVPHDILSPAQPIRGNIQSQARAARYALLHRWRGDRGLRWIATAHHADDQRETLLMRLARGSGLAGLAGIRPVNGPVIRPLLERTKQELIALCATEGVTPCHDPSNDDHGYDRVRIRQWLEKADFPVSAPAAARSAHALADAEQALLWSLDQLAVQRIRQEGEQPVLLDVTGLPREYRRRLVQRILSGLDPDAATRLSSIDRALDSLMAGERLTLGAVLCSGGADIWTFRPAPPRHHAVLPPVN